MKQYNRIAIFFGLWALGFGFGTCFAQPYGNEWIDYSRKYYKFTIAENGIYRIDYNALSGAGFGSVDWRYFQVFGRGEELWLYVEDDGDNLPEPGEFLEFYAQKNDGSFDTPMYKDLFSNQPDPLAQANPNYSLFNDSAVYYLTYNNTSFFNKRMTLETDVNFGSYTAASWFFKEERQDYTSNYYGGYYDGNNASVSEYTEAEGWFDAAFGALGSQTKNISTPDIFASGPGAVINTVVVGANSKPHPLEIHINSVLFKDTTHNSFNIARFNFTVPLATLSSPTTEFRFYSTSSQVDRQAISWISVKYPHTFNLGNSTIFQLLLPDDISQSKSFLDISNFNTYGSTARLYDLSNNKRITVVPNGSNLNALVPNSGGEKQCYLTSDNAISYITSLKPVSSTGYFTDYTDGFVPDSAFLIVTHKLLWTEANDYANYRNLPVNNHNAVVIDIDELYDQFAYGIVKHPLSIRGFCDFLSDNMSMPPNYLFLLGKSIRAHDIYAGQTLEKQGSRKNPVNYANNLIPTYGDPESDNLLTGGLDGSLYVPAIPTGRLSAKDGDEVTFYLNKVIEHENQAHAEWMKYVLHFGGGSTANEQSQFAGYLKAYEDTIKGIYFGGYVSTFLKNTSAPVQQTVADSVRDFIENGVSLLTFFGHAWGGGFDQNIDEPENYDNKGKYPFLLALSCYAGGIHHPVTPASLSVSEKFVIIEDKGAIGFLASVNLGNSGYLNIYADNFYRNLGRKFYGQGVGKIVQETIRAIESPNFYIKTTSLEMTLHGDPAVVINAHEKPDLSVLKDEQPDQPDVFFTPSIVNTEVDSFDINIVITNIGRATDESFSVEVTREFPTNPPQSKLSLEIIPYLYFKDTVKIRFPVDVVNGVGLNTFHIRVDSDGMIDELKEDNNNVTVVLPIKSEGIAPVFPYHYAIVPNNTVTLKASTLDPFAPATSDYKFQIDTTDSFNSPFLLSQSIIDHPGGVVKWTPPLTFTDSTVYYWRVGPDTTSHLWRESSFQYIPGKTGWGQAHFYQFKNDIYNYIGYNRPERRFDFITVPHELHCRTIGSASTPTQWTGTRYDIDGEVQAYSSGGVYDAMLIAVIDSMTLEAQGPDKVYIFYSEDSTNRIAMANLLNSVQSGNYILAYTFIDGNFKMWENIAHQAFQNLGSTMLITGPDTLDNNIPYIFFVQKGYPASVKEVKGATPTDTIDLYVDLINNWPYGDITSTIIGPSANWGSLHWSQHELESNDSIRLQVRGIMLDGTDTIIAGLDNLPPDSSDIYNLNDRVDAALYPYLKLNVFIRDDTLQTPTQLDRWQVIYDGVPEAALNPSVYYNFHKDTLTEGEMLQFATVVENISDYDMDSLLISYWIVDKDRVVYPLSYKHQKPLLKSPDTLLTSIEYSTNGLTGDNNLWIEVNPKDSLWQLEQYHFNNIAQIQFYVHSDRTNPLLDVTFDGVHILDGDIVSAKPYILIQLNDENKYLALDTVSLLQVYIKKPGEEFEVQVPYNDKTLRFIPAALPDNKAKLEYTPEFTEDGIYELIVGGQDRSKNESGALNYSISFEVINKPSITEVLNWPNPFSTSTRFVFTLTGSEVPSKFKIQIMTITGKVVKEIFADELGPIHIGPNITDYAWDGKDQFGDQLANGIYLYKVVVLLNGSPIEKRETAADKYFHKGFGKMYLMR